MAIINNFRALLFDYGGTLDTPAKHWSEIFWEGYQQARVPVRKEEFYDAYVFAERTLGAEPQRIKRHYNMQQLVEEKIALQMQFLHDNHLLPADYESWQAEGTIVLHSYHTATEHTAKSAQILSEIYAAGKPMALVSNFYGNLNAVLADFALLPYFTAVFDSAIVGIRKPDPAIWQLGVDAIRAVIPDVKPEEILVVGDNLKVDILPAQSLHLTTAHLCPSGVSAAPGMVIKSLEELV